MDFWGYFENATKVLNTSIKIHWNVIFKSIIFYQEIFIDFVYEDIENLINF